MRTPIMAGNWKMNCTNDEACALACALAEKAGSVAGCEVVLCPPATALSTVAGCVKDTKIEVGAQNMLWEAKGAFTGEISAAMILSTGAKWVIIGHSERRGRMSKLPDGWTEDLMLVFGDTDHSVNVKTKAALAAGLKPIVACGETEAEYDAVRRSPWSAGRCARCSRGSTRRKSPARHRLRAGLGDRHGQGLRL